MSPPVLTEDTLKDLEELLGKAEKQRYVEFDSENDGKLYFYFRKNAPEILRLAKLGKKYKEHDEFLQDEV